jgi:hypothetical protein
MDPKVIPPVVPEAPAPADYDVMSSVFDGLLAPTPPTEGDGTPSPTEVDAAAAAAKDETPPVVPPVVTPPVDGTPPTEVAPPVVPPVVETPPVTPPPEEIDWKARFDALQAEKAAAPPVTPPAPVTPPPVEPPQELYTPEEKEELAAYERDWSQNARAEALRRRGEYSQLVKHIFSEITREFGPLIERGVAAADTVAETSALTVIQRAHNDYDDQMYDDVISWADNLTGTRKRIAQAVIEGGDPVEVVDLITEFKSATGRKPRVVADGSPSPVVPPVVTEISAAAKKAAKALGVVDSKRSTPATQADPNDFESAWEEAVSAK